MAFRDNLQLLRQRYYYATWKADGTRYMMLITVDGCYLIDRNFNFRRVQMRFPCRNTTDVCMHIPLLFECSLCSMLNIFLLFIGEILSDIFLFFSFFFFVCKGLADKTHHYTLLDGEMIIDKIPDTNKKERRYLIYDMMAINQVSIIEVGFTVFILKNHTKCLILIVQENLYFNI